MWSNWKRRSLQFHCSPKQHEIIFRFILEVKKFSSGAAECLLLQCSAGFSQYSHMAWTYITTTGLQFVIRLISQVVFDILLTFPPPHRFYKLSFNRFIVITWISTTERHSTLRMDTLMRFRTFRLVLWKWCIWWLRSYLHRVTGVRCQIIFTQNTPTIWAIFIGRTTGSKCAGHEKANQQNFHRHEDD